jgi:hypothetical protein
MIFICFSDEAKFVVNIQIVFGVHKEKGAQIAPRALQNGSI